jgi:hypothetical protein
MLQNSLKSLVIHIIISASAYFYTASPYLNHNRLILEPDKDPYSYPHTIYLIIMISSLILYHLIGRMFLEDQLSSSKNMLSIGLVPLIGMVLWTLLWIKNKASIQFQLTDWEPYLIYIGYTTPFIYRYISSWHILPIFSWIPAIILFFSIPTGE